MKMTYSARVTVSAPLTALMSALRIEAPEGAVIPPSRYAASLSAPHATYAFEQPLPIPSYLVALAVGELECRTLGPISKVWSEPSVVESAAYEFAETANFLRVGASPSLRYCTTGD